MKEPFSDIKKGFIKQYIDDEISEEKLDIALSYIDDLETRKPPTIEELRAIEAGFREMLEKVNCESIFKDISTDNIKPTHYSGIIH